MISLRVRLVPLVRTASFMLIIRGLQGEEADVEKRN